jgi:hypothetical protein
MPAALARNMPTTSRTTNTQYAGHAILPAILQELLRESVQLTPATPVWNTRETVTVIRIGDLVKDQVGRSKRIEENGERDRAEESELQSTTAARDSNARRLTRERMAPSARGYHVHRA